MSAESSGTVREHSCCAETDVRSDQMASCVLRRLMPRLGVLGITRLGDITGLDRIGVPVVQAVRPLGLANSVTQGKGRDLAAAAVIGRAQRVRSLELHTPTSKTRLLASFEQRQPAYACLDLVYAPLSGGVETQDLLDAGRLTQELR